MHHLDDLGHVSTEGGPLLLIDLHGVAEWAGIDSDDYDRACRLLETQRPGAEIQVGEQRGLLWDVPTGTTDVFRTAVDRLLLSRSWLEPASESEERAELRRLVELPPSEMHPVGRLTVASGWLAILWATENGADIARVSPADGLSLDLSVGHAAVLVRVAPGEYACTQDEVTHGGPSALRCWIGPAD